MDEKVHYCELFDVYSQLLTDRQREIAELYFYKDLSFGEIAEIFSISRQSVNDALKTVRSELDDYESKLKYSQILGELRNFARTLDEKSSKRLTEIINE